MKSLILCLVINEITPSSGVYVAKHIRTGIRYYCFRFTYWELKKEYVFICKKKIDSNFNPVCLSIENAKKYYLLEYEVNPSHALKAFIRHNKSEDSRIMKMKISSDYIDRIKNETWIPE